MQKLFGGKNMKLLQNYFFVMYAFFAILFFVLLLLVPFFEIRQPSGTEFWLIILGAMAAICYLLNKVEKLQMGKK